LKSVNDRVPPPSHAETGTTIELEMVPDADDGIVSGLLLNPLHCATTVTPPYELPATGSRLTAVKLMVQLVDTAVLDTLLNEGVAQLSATSA
jgi:hypothetical protein